MNEHTLARVKAEHQVCIPAGVTQDLLLLSGYAGGTPIISFIQNILKTVSTQMDRQFGSTQSFAHNIQIKLATLKMFAFPDNTREVTLITFNPIP